MKTVILALAWAAMAAAYLSDNVLEAPDDVDNMAALHNDCQPNNGEKAQQPTESGQCSSAVYVRLDEGSSAESASERDLLGEAGTAPVTPARDARANDNFIRFGRNDNFIRFGRDRADNFIRLGRGRADNFIRFGRGRQDNFIRFGRNKQDSFFPTGSDSSEREADVNSKQELSTGNNLMVGRGGRSDSNFIRLGRARPSTGFIRLGRGNDEAVGPGQIRRSNSNFVRFGRETYGDKLERQSRSSGNSDLRRGKLTDRNFIRLGRSGQRYDDDDTEGQSDDKYEESPDRSEKRGKTANFVRFGRDVAHRVAKPTLPSGESAPSDKHIRRRRSVFPSAEDETPEDSSDYTISVSKNAYDDDKMSSIPDDSQIPFRYYSPQASGLPNYILGPELSVLGPLANGRETQTGKVDGRNTNHIRLG
jgi:hypothetical protein